MGKITGSISLICGFLVPYVSDQSVTILSSIILQILFYAASVYYFFMWDDM